MSRTRLLGFIIQWMSYIVPEELMKTIFRMSPRKNVRELLKISDIMRRRSQEIIDEKRVALRKGDEALLQEVGEGKDLMSICRKCPVALLNVVEFE